MSKYTKFAKEEDRIVFLRTLKYPNGGKFLMTETKKTLNGFSHALKDLQTNEQVRNDNGSIKYVSDEQLNKIIIK